MASSQVILLQLLLVALASATHYFGGTQTATYKGRNPDGTHKVVIRNRDTFDWRFGPLRWFCSRGHCGSSTQNGHGLIDRSTNSPRSTSQWFESETIETRILPSDKPFEMMASSCCWVYTEIGYHSWSLQSSFDFGRRSDTGKPNRSPDIAILPFLRVPENCPRTYKLMASDPDGDTVRCRYGNVRHFECGGCKQQHSGFTLNQDSCELHYRYHRADPRVHGFEMVVEDFPQRNIALQYSDGSRTTRSPLNARRKRAVYPWWITTSTPQMTTPPPTATTTTPSTTTPWWLNPTWWRAHASTPQTTTHPPTTTTTPHPWWWWSPTTTPQMTTPPPTTTTPSTTTPWWLNPTWWRAHASTPQTTTHPPTTTTTPHPWWWWSPTTTPQMTTPPPTTTTTTPSTTTPWWLNPTWRRAHASTPQTTTHPPTTTTSPTTTPHPWWWWSPTTTLEMTTPPTTTTTTSSTTTTPWWWNPHWWRTTTSAPQITTPPPTTTTPPTTTPWWWNPHWWRTTTSAPQITTPPPTTTTSPITIPWWWWWHSSTTTTTTRRPSSTNPLSKLPLQFSLLVDPPAPSCQEGRYLPRLVHPTPENGQRIHAEVNREVEIRVKATATHASIHDIIMSGPLNISSHRTAHDEFVIRWTPIEDDLGDHFPICFAVETVTQSALTAVTVTHSHHHHHFTPTSHSGIYQSEMRCVVVEVKVSAVVSHVTCGESTMRVEIEKASFSGLHEDHLRLSDDTNTVCSLQRHSNSTHVIAEFPLNACGTLIEEDDNNLFFKNEITTVDNRQDLITRKHLLELQFYCKYPKRGNVTMGFGVHRPNTTVWERGFGTFTYQFEFFTDDQYRSMIQPSSYPLVYDVGSRIYMEIEATSTLNNTELFVESCSASPYDNPNYWPTYAIIENGCIEDSTVQIHSPSHERHFKFSMEAFKFIGLHDQVYITCSVLMCEAGGHDTRCSEGCVNSTAWGDMGRHHHRRRRESASQTSRHFISQGPLRLRRSTETTGSTVVNLNLNLVFITGCLLAAVGMICAAVMYKTKTSRGKYQPLPVYES